MNTSSRYPRVLLNSLLLALSLSIFPPVVLASPAKDIAEQLFLFQERFMGNVFLRLKVEEVAALGSYKRLDYETDHIRIILSYIKQHEVSGNKSARELFLEMIKERASVAAYAEVSEKYGMSQPDYATAYTELFGHYACFTVEKLEQSLWEVLSRAHFHMMDADLRRFCVSIGLTADIHAISDKLLSVQSGKAASSELPVSYAPSSLEEPCILSACLNEDKKIAVFHVKNVAAVVTDLANKGFLGNPESLFSTTPNTQERKN